MTAVMAGGLAQTAEAADAPRDAEWHLDALHMPEVWQTSTGAGITVAIIDSGVKTDLPDLVGQVLPGKDFSGLPGGVDVDPEGHGTSMAGIIAGSGKSFDGKGDYGLAPGAKVLPIKINTNSDASTAIGPAASLKQIDEAITFAADQNAQVISISQAIRSVDIGQADISALQTAVNYAIGKGSLIVAGAGNSGQEGNPVMYPAAAAGVAAIAGFDHTGVVTPESESGPQIALTAPGLDIYSVCTGPTGYCKGHGTSDATALTAAAAAIVWSVHPTWTGNQVLRVLINTANKPNDGSNRNNHVGFGSISPRTALNKPGDPGPADVNPLVAAGIGIAPLGAPSGAASAAPSSAPATAPTTANGGSGASSAPVPAKSAGASSGSSSLPLVAGGVVAALVLVGGVFFFLRKRRSQEPAVAGVPGQPQSPYGQPPFEQSSYGQSPYAQQAPGGYQPPAGYGSTPPPPSYGPGPVGGGGQNQQGPPSVPPVNPYKS
ncbi:type VII secretion-associated serine protease mycosin [Kitasatospora sp. MAA4]|uniref:S8 family serine peptidase n=1 Tax=Kitasatospora sp. MAA4 TaxID=3035093 RepID=UPI002474522D|nr:S8 family serine peptidase [Kitasatospora sp. MAA4]MDH6136356.1 type VII secretion-associated serine protease mycosin [Kitasatospora sp. MAA4]